MVYESDFYTTRRPYSSSSRPYVSSYSVTVRAIPHMPYTAHKKLVTIVRTVPVRIYHAGAYWPVVRTFKLQTRVRPSIIAAELNRIRYLTRPSYVSYVEKYLNSKGFTAKNRSVSESDDEDINMPTKSQDDATAKTKDTTEEDLTPYTLAEFARDFDDEAKDIRAKTAKLLRNIHVFVPRPSLSDYEEHTLPERLRSDDYVRRIINAKNARKDIDSLPWYSTPEKRSIGGGHLACIKYAGGKAQPKRRSYYTVGDLVPGDVKSDVKLMSYYLKNRKAAEDASPLIIQHHSVPIREDHDVDATTTITWADEIVHEEEIVMEAPTAAAEEEEPIVVAAAVASVPLPAEEETPIETEVQLTEPEVEAKPEKKKKKEKKVKVEESNVEKEAVEASEPVADENDVQKTPDEDTIKKVQDYIEKKAAEKKMEEERRAWELEEARKHAEQLELARLAKIKEEQDIRIAEMKEQERLEAERRAILDRAEELRKEAERLKEDEKLFNDAIQQAIADEKERVAQEEEEFLRKQLEEDKEKLDLDSTTDVANEIAIAEEPHSEDHSLHIDISDQEVEAKPYEVDHDEDTQIEEDEPEEPTELENPFVDGEGAGVAVQGDEPTEEAPQVRTGGAAGDEGGFDWSDFDETTVAEAKTVEQAPKAVEESVDADADNQQAFEEEEAQKQSELEETQVEETQAQEEKVKEETEATEESHAEEDVDIWEGVAEETSSQWRRMSTYRQEIEETQVVEETRVEESTEESQTVEEMHEEETRVEEEINVEEAQEETDEVQIQEVYEDEVQADDEEVAEEMQVEDKTVHDASEEELEYNDEE